MMMEKHLERLRGEYERPIRISLAGGLGFYVAFVTSHAVAIGLRASSSSMRGSAFALVALGCSSVASAYASDIAASVKSLDTLRPLRQTLGKNDWERTLSVAACCFTGSLTFRLLGGRLRSVLPSEFIHIGSFARTRHALPTGIEYADQKTKQRIVALGKRYGCHTCGDKRAEKYIADHMPPNKFVKEANQHWFRRALGQRFAIKQHFYPQCETCSLTQSHVVRLPPRSKRPLRSTFSRFRLYHFTGILLGPAFVFLWEPNRENLSIVCTIIT